MLASQAAQDAIASNLANASTTGYKQDVPEFSSFANQLITRMDADGQVQTVGPMGHGATVSSIATDFSQGSIQQTGDPLDLAINGNGYLAVNSANGTMYTRNGELALSAQNTLQTSTGLTVAGADGKAIKIPAATAQIKIDPQGRVTADGKTVGQLSLVSITAANDPIKMGDSLFAANNPGAATGASVQQGYLETSNVSVVKEMVSMIAVQRAYEADQKVVQAEDELTNHAVNDVPKV